MQFSLKLTMSPSHTKESLVQIDHVTLPYNIVILINIVMNIVDPFTIITRKEPVR